MISEVWGELALYQGYAEKSGVPYQDFNLEYPPLALELFKLANILGEEWFTLMWYGMVLIAVLVTCLFIKKMKGKPFHFLAVVLPLGGLFWDRFDIFPAMFSLGAFYFAVAGSYWALPFLLTGVLLKIYPIILLPFVIGSLLVRGKITEVVFGLLVFVCGFALVYKNHPNWMNCVFGFHGDRGIQIESVRAIPKLINGGEVIYSHNTFEIK